MALGSTQPLPEKSTRNISIQTVASNKPATTQTVKEARTIKLLNRQGKTVAFQWVLSHIGTHGNKTADLLAKKGATLKKTYIP
jgi:ribonuclease HI